MYFPNLPPLFRQFYRAVYLKTTTAAKSKIKPGHDEQFVLSLGDAIQESIPESILGPISNGQRNFVKSSAINVWIRDFKSDDVWGLNFVSVSEDKAGAVAHIHINSDLFLDSFNPRRDREYRKCILAHEFLEAMHNLLLYHQGLKNTSRTVHSKEQYWALSNLLEEGSTPPWVDSKSHLNHFISCWEDLLVSSDSIRRLCLESNLMEDVDDLKIKHLKFLSPFDPSDRDIMSEACEIFSRNLCVNKDLVVRRVREIMASS